MGGGPNVARYCLGNTLAQPRRVAIRFYLLRCSHCRTVASHAAPVDARPPARPPPARQAAAAATRQAAAARPPLRHTPGRRRPCGLRHARWETGERRRGRDLLVAVDFGPKPPTPSTPSTGRSRTSRASPTRSTSSTPSPVYLTSEPYLDFAASSATASPRRRGFAAGHRRRRAAPATACPRNGATAGRDLLRAAAPAAAATGSASPAAAVPAPGFAADRPTPGFSPPPDLCARGAGRDAARPSA
ncbi:hypothetical protein PAHAL_1G124100 [Panicum hallii]|uniref:Uncharacterized protein n=1 Tax=Panicum hallii TaxID=206008 RepID=A0A2T8KV02_9POAL|nr:hypothetical protein PAHAL_1G124100 [Panicum hallii]